MKKLIVIILLMSICTMASAVDIVIKDVPSGAEEAVKAMAMVAIDRFIKSRDVKVASQVQTKYETDIDTIRVANNLEKVFSKVVDVQDPTIIEKQ